MSTLVADVRILTTTCDGQPSLDGNSKRSTQNYLSTFEILTVHKGEAHGEHVLSTATHSSLDEDLLCVDEGVVYNPGWVGRLYMIGSSGKYRLADGNGVGAIVDFDQTVLDDLPVCAEQGDKDVRIPSPLVDSDREDDGLNTGCDTSGGSPLNTAALSLLALIGLARRLR